MTDIPTGRSRDRHQTCGDQREKQHNGSVPTCRARGCGAAGAAAVSPQTDEREQACDLHRHKGNEGRAFMTVDKSLRKVRQRLDRVCRGVSAQIHRDRRNRQE